MNKKRLITCAALALSITIVAGSGALRRPDKWLQDTLFQTPSVSSGDIVIIGIDEDSFKQFGPYTSWDRNIMASALEALAADPDQRPAVVAIDTLYAGTTAAAADAHLAAAAADGPALVGFELLQKAVEVSVHRFAGVEQVAVLFDKLFQLIHISNFFVSKSS